MKLYNTLTRSVDEFIPIEKDNVGIYTCGPTVYKYAHIGNLRIYIHEDILVKTFEYLGYNVKRVMNVTDVGHLESDADDGEDKMLKSAKTEHKSVWDIAEFYTKAFFSDCDKLHIKRPDVRGKATDYIDDYIKIIKTLEEKGFTYFVNGNVYFDISKKADYTKLSRLNLDELNVAHREGVTVDENKKNPQDFVLWFTKSKFDNQAMKWDSPWGIGYPGWHIECSTIALKNFGPHLDIHCGGVDHIPVHHTNEIAQTESYTGENWVNYWWHGDFLLDKGKGKMSKSKGGILTVSVLEENGFNPLVYRYFVLGSHYRKQLAFSYDSLEQAKYAYNKLKKRVQSLKDEGEISQENIDKYDNEFKNFLMDDLNTANAITVLYDVLKAENLNDAEKLTLVKKFEQVLSLGLLDEYVKEEISSDLSDYIDGMIEKRKQAKKNKDFAAADSIRAELLEKGIVIKDTRDGVVWSKVNE